MTNTTASEPLLSRRLRLATGVLLCVFSTLFILNTLCVYNADCHDTPVSVKTWLNAQQQTHRPFEFNHELLCDKVPPQQGPSSDHDYVNTTDCADDCFCEDSHAPLAVSDAIRAPAIKILTTPTHTTIGHSHMPAHHMALPLLRIATKLDIGSSTLSCLSTVVLLV